LIVTLGQQNNYICFVIIKTQKPDDYNLGPTETMSKSRGHRIL